MIMNNAGIKINKKSILDNEYPDNNILSPPNELFQLVSAYSQKRYESASSSQQPNLAAVERRKYSSPTEKTINLNNVHFIHFRFIDFRFINTKILYL